MRTGRRRRTHLAFQTGNRTGCAQHLYAGGGGSRRRRSYDQMRENTPKYTIIGQQNIPTSSFSTKYSA